MMDLPGVVRPLFWPGHALQSLDVRGEDRPDSILTLHHAVDNEDGLTVRDLTVTVVDVGLDRDIDLSELVFEREEADLLRGRWGLAGDDEPGDPHSSTAGDRRKLVALEGAELVQPVPAEMDEVVAGREIGDAVLELVDVEIVELGKAGRYRFQLQLRLRLDAAPQHAAVPSLLPAPQQLAAWPAEPVERADHDEVADGMRADGAAAEAVEEIVKRGVGAAADALGDDGLASILTEVADIVEADSHRPGQNRHDMRVWRQKFVWEPYETRVWRQTC